MLGGCCGPPVITNLGGKGRDPQNKLAGGTSVSVSYVLIEKACLKRIGRGMMEEDSSHHSWASTSMCTHMYVYCTHVNMNMYVCTTYEKKDKCLKRERKKTT